MHVVALAVDLRAILFYNIIEFLKKKTKKKLDYLAFITPKTYTKVVSKLYSFIIKLEIVANFVAAIASKLMLDRHSGWYLTSDPSFALARATPHGHDYHTSQVA